MATLNYHPAAELFPMMGPDELKELADDIEKNGQRCPIELYDGQILDGRNRYEACRLADVEPDTIKVDSFSIGNDPWAYVISLNLQRRHLTQSQKAMIGQQYLEHCREDADKRKKAGQPSGNVAGRSGDSRDQAGEAVGVSGKLIDAADKVATKGAKELVDAVKAGTVPVTTAAKLAEAPKAEQRKAVKEGPKAVKEAAKRIESSGGVNGKPAGANPASTSEDSAGQPIPKALREVFDRSKEFEAHARTLTAIQKWAEEIGTELPGKWLHVQSFKADLNNAKQALRHNKPYAVCPYCQAKKPKCEACKGVGFVSKRIYDGAPQELRA